MKKLITGAILASLSVIAVNSIAQPHGNSEDRMERRIERMSERLQLDETQRAQLEDLFRQQSAKRQALREESRAQLRGILTEAQIADMESMRGQHRQHRGERGKHGKHRHGGGCAEDAGIKQVPGVEKSALKGVSL